MIIKIRVSIHTFIYGILSALLFLFTYLADLPNTLSDKVKAVYVIIMFITMLSFWIGLMCDNEKSD